MKNSSICGHIQETRVNNLTETELSNIRDIIDKDYIVEGDLRSRNVS